MQEGVKEGPCAGPHAEPGLPSPRLPESSVTCPVVLLVRGGCPCKCVHHFHPGVPESRCIWWVTAHPHTPLHGPISLALTQDGHEGEAKIITGRGASIPP